MAGAPLGGGGGARVAAGMPALFRPQSNLADHIFKFCMKASIVLSLCYFVLLVYIAASISEWQNLKLLPFFGVAVVVPFYAAALLREYDI